MKYLKKTLKILLMIVGVIAIFSLMVFTAHYIPVNSHSSSTEKKFYLSDNGRHIDIILYENGHYVSYGWGSRVFFTQVPTWDDLTYTIGFQALFTKPESIMRIKNYYEVKDNWIKVNCSKKQYDIVEKMIYDSFKRDPRHGVIEYISEIEYNNATFYEANGNYNVLHTCNTWVNDVLYEADLRCCLHSLTSDAIINLYKSDT